MKKQFETVFTIKHIIKQDQNRVKNNSIRESSINKLIGMSVGRVKIWNYNSLKNELCWVNGFTEITNNKYTRIQLRRLDSSRNRLIHNLDKSLKSINDDHLQSIRKRKRNNDHIYYGKPFSYYFQALKNK